MMNLLMADPKDIPDAPDLIKACYAYDVEKFKLLLDSGADVNCLDTRDNLTSLHIACLYNYNDIVDIILRHHEETGKVDFTLKSKHSQRLAWMYAGDAGHQELAEKVWKVGFEIERERQLSELKKLSNLKRQRGRDLSNSPK